MSKRQPLVFGYEIVTPTGDDEQHLCPWVQVKNRPGLFVNASDGKLLFNPQYPLGPRRVETPANPVPAVPQVRIARPFVGNVSNKDVIAVTGLGVTISEPAQPVAYDDKPARRVLTGDDGGPVTEVMHFTVDEWNEKWNSACRQIDKVTQTGRDAMAQIISTFNPEGSGSWLTGEWDEVSIRQMPTQVNGKVLPQVPAPWSEPTHIHFDSSGKQDHTIFLVEEDFLFIKKMSDPVWQPYDNESNRMSREFVIRQLERSLQDGVIQPLQATHSMMVEGRNTYWKLQNDGAGGHVFIGIEPVYPNRSTGQFIPASHEKKRDTWPIRLKQPMNLKVRR